MRLYGMGDDRLQVIPLANSLTEEPGARPIPEPYLLYVGPRGGYKNFQAVLEALVARPRITHDHMLCCFGGGAWTRAERARLEVLGLTDRVHQTGGDDRALASFYAHAAALVYPSRYEGFGIPPLEAMHYGCPVVLLIRH